MTTSFNSSCSNFTDFLAGDNALTGLGLPPKIHTAEVFGDPKTGFDFTSAVESKVYEDSPLAPKPANPTCTIPLACHSTASVANKDHRFEATMDAGCPAAASAPEALQPPPTTERSPLGERRCANQQIQTFQLSSSSIKTIYLLGSNGQFFTAPFRDGAYQVNMLIHGDYPCDAYQETTCSPPSPDAETASPTFPPFAMSQEQLDFFAPWFKEAGNALYPVLERFAKAWPGTANRLHNDQDREEMAGHLIEMVSREIQSRLKPQPSTPTANEFRSNELPGTFFTCPSEVSAASKVDGLSGSSQDDILSDLEANNAEDIADAENMDPELNAGPKRSWQIETAALWSKAHVHCHDASDSDYSGDDKSLSRFNRLWNRRMTKRLGNSVRKTKLTRPMSTGEMEIYNLNGSESDAQASRQRRSQSLGPQLGEGVKKQRRRMRSAELQRHIVRDHRNRLA